MLARMAGLLPFVGFRPHRTAAGAAPDLDVARVAAAVAGEQIGDWSVRQAHRSIDWNPTDRVAGR